MQIMRRAVVVFAIAAAAMAMPAAARATGGEGEAWPSFNESSACGAVFMRTPYIDGTGRISRDTILRGPYAAMFGRTVDQVFDNLTRWDVPGSPEHITTHNRVLTALLQVATGIERAMASGLSYRVDAEQTSAIAARTIGGESRLSRHTFGIAMDINSRRNPFRQDNRLITDFPAWWLQAFADAGFCWGGLWVGSKDTMHFAWQGPAFTAGATLPRAFPPLTEATDFSVLSARVPVVPRPLPAVVQTVLADGDGNYATDVVYVSRLGGDLVVDVSSAARNHNACSVRRSVVADAPAPAASGFGDWDGRGGADLWLLGDDGGNARLTVRYAYGDYAAETAVTTAVPTPSANAWVSTADYDRDGDLDLFVVEGDRITVWAIDPAIGTTRLLLAGTTAVGGGELMLGDHDGDELPDLWSLSGGTLSVANAAGRYRAVEATFRPPSLPAAIVDAGVADYDGDGRADLMVFDGAEKSVWLGNTPLPDGEPPEVWFLSDEPDCRELEPTWDELGVRFGSGGFATRGAVGWLERIGMMPKRCDPTDENLDCPPEPATAGDLAASMAWLLDLDPVPGLGDGNGYDAAARALLASGHDSPCPVGDDA
ncbi:MAG: hypothetical protein EHM57_04170, partial [Actinobacteria bacterium]